MKERYWTFIMYPDSRPEDWKEYLQETGLQIAISPLHDKDINADETQKKPHYHVVLCFNGPTTYKRVEEITNHLNATIPKRVMSLIGVIRYLTHKDNPEKAQYNEEEIITMNGLDINEIDGMTTTMIESMKRAIIDLIRNLEMYEYATLIEYLRDNNMQDMLKVASNNTMFINSYLKSRKGRIQEEIKRIDKLKK